MLTSEIIGTTRNNLVETLHSACPSAKRLLFLSDVTDKEVLHPFNPHRTVALSGFLLAAFKDDPSAQLHHCGMRHPFRTDPYVKAYFPMKHFRDKPPGRFRRRFYTMRLETVEVLKVIGPDELHFQENALLGPSYSEEMGRYLVSIATVPSRSHPYLVAKFWQIMSAGSLLVAVMVGPCKAVFADAGFRDGEHYVAATTRNVVEKVRWALDPANRDAVDRMRRAGHAAVQASHLPEHRAKQLHDVAVELGSG